MSHLELTALIVRDYDAALRFFVDVLGFDLVEDSPALTNDGRAKRWVVVRPSGGQTGILLERADGEHQHAFAGRQFAGRVGLFLRVEDFEAAYARMAGAGVHFVSPPRDEPYGRVAVFLDTEGNRWDLLGPDARQVHHGYQGEPGQRVRQLVDLLGLRRHPEGGSFAEVYRSALAVECSDGRGRRAALTSIYFLLASGEVSRWHRVASDEAWHYCEGDPLELFVADPAFEAIERHVIGPVAGSTRPVHVVPAHQWQAARTLGHYTLVGCTVGPGFEFADFELIEASSPEAEKVRQQRPELAAFL